MSEEIVVADEEFDLAIKVIDAWHQQKKLSWVLVNTGNIIVAKSGFPLSLESALNHAHKLTEFENGQRIQMNAAAAEANKSLPPEQN